MTGDLSISPGDESVAWKALSEERGYEAPPPENSCDTVLGIRKNRIFERNTDYSMFRLALKSDSLRIRYFLREFLHEPRILPAHRIRRFWARQKQETPTVFLDFFDQAERKSAPPVPEYLHTGKGSYTVMMSHGDGTIYRNFEYGAEERCCPLRLQVGG